MKANKVIIWALALLALGQQAKSVTFNQWLTLGASLTVASFIGYQWYEMLEQSDESNEETSGFAIDFSNYNNTSKTLDVKGPYSSKETLNAQEYAHELKKLIEDQEAYPFMLDRVFNVINEKHLKKEVLEYSFDIRNDKQTLYELSKGTWAEEYVYDYYKQESQAWKTHTDWIKQRFSKIY